MAIEGITQAKWLSYTPAQRETLRDNSGLSQQLIGLEGWRVEVLDKELSGGAMRRFIVGKSTGWQPCHLEIHNRRSHGGNPANREYQSVRKLYKVR